MKLTQETRVTTPDGFLTHESLIELTGGYVSKRAQEKKLTEKGIKYVPGRNVIYVRAEDVFGISHEKPKTPEEAKQEPNYSALSEGGNGKKSKRPSHKGDGAT